MEQSIEQTTLPPKTVEESNARFEKTVRENIKKRRLEAGLTQGELAKLVGYADKSMIAKIEAGKTVPSLEKLEQFAEALNTTALELAGFPPIKPPTPEQLAAWEEELEIEASIERSERMAQLVLDPVVVPLIQHNPVIHDNYLNYDENRIEYIPAPRTVEDVSMAIEVRDNAMQPSGIPEDSIAFISKDNIVDDGEICAAVIDGAFVVRRMYYEEATDLYIFVADNPAFPPLYSPAEKRDELFLAGKVLWVLAKLK
ncbi:MAG: LexA family transcriptional regulator [Peptococcaceae bacterium]|nr:LexA family transcriptional regulator [Peptococcaceae bacterium]